MPTLTRRTDERRARIERDVLRATEDLLREGASFAELSIERIAGAAGLSRTAFYFYFRDKRELLTRLTEEVAADLYAEAEGWWSAADDGEDELRDSLARVLTLYREHGVLLRAVVETAAYDEPVAVTWRQIIGRFVERTRRRIEAEQAAGRLDPALPAEPLAFSLVWMVERACYQQLAQGRETLDDAFVGGITAVWTRTLYARS